MSVVPLTLTISLCLVFTFVLFFLREHSRRRFGGTESESLLPLADEIPQVVSRTGACDNHSEPDEPRGCRGRGDCTACQLRAVHRDAGVIRA